MSASAKNRPPMSEETKKLIGEASTKRGAGFQKGHIVSEETRKKQSEAAKNRAPITEEHRKILSESHKRN